MFDGVLELAEHQQRLRDRGFGRATVTEILRDRLFETGLIVRDHRPQPRQPVQPFIERRGGLGPRQSEHQVKGVIQHTFAGGFQRLIHGLSSGLPDSAWAFCSTCGNSALDGGFCPVWSRFGGLCGHKNLKTGSPALSKAYTRWYTAPATPGIRQGLPSQEALGRDRSALKGVAQSR